jgi:predicted nucleotidyltransferase
MKFRRSLEIASIIDARPPYKKEVLAIIEALQPAFEQDQHIRQVILFGSQVKNTATIMSDIDFAIVADNPRLIDRKALNNIAENFDIPCDFVYTTPEALRLANKELDVNNSIRKEGIIIWERSAVTSTFPIKMP